MTIRPPASEILASPDWLPFRVTEDGVQFLAMNPEAYRAASFLDERIVGDDAVFADLAWGELRPLPQAQNAHCIFHMGHVGSTLISRLLQDLPGVFALREPAILRGLVAGSPTAVPAWEATPSALRQERLRMIARLLSRTYQPGQAAIVKATSYVSDLGPELLTYLGGRAVLMVVKPAVYLASVLAGPNTAAELASLANSRQARLSRYLGGGIDLDPDDLSQVAALSWLTEVCALARIEAAHPGQRLWVDFEAFLEAPAPGLGRIAAHFSLDAPVAEVETVLAGPTTTRYSKDPSYRYTPADRRALAAEAQREHAPGIARAMAWLNGVGGAFPEARQAMTAMAAGVKG